MEEEELVLSPTDKYLASLSCFYEIFETLSSKELNIEGLVVAAADKSMIFYSRIGSSVLKLAKNNVCHLFKNPLFYLTFTFRLLNIFSLIQTRVNFLSGMKKLGGGSGKSK